MVCVVTDPERRRARGFTLVELLVVIAIIGVLIALLVVAIGRAQVTVREGAMATEVQQLGQSLQAFKTNYQVDFPPDFTTPPQFNKEAIDRYLQRIFRYRNPQTDVPRGQGGLQPQLLASLDPAEALYFWLRGFSKDPQNPLFGPLGADPNNVERTPIFEFDKERLRDLDGDGFLEYYPEYATERPFIYYVHYNYVNTFARPETELLVRRGPNMQAVLPAPRPYLSAVPVGGNFASLEATARAAYPKIKTNYAAPETFQIICAGLDNEFGFQVPINQFEPFAYPNGPYPVTLNGMQTAGHRDNITNFVDRTLESAMP
jgi:prepilin-type N-terminal cleavage/methylation domain-containing protein